MTLEDGRGGYIRKADLEKKLKSIGKYAYGLRQPEMSQIWKQSEEYRSEWSEAEELAERLGALLLHLPNAHPYLNPIECLWRATKQSYRRNGRRSLPVLFDEIRAYLGQPVTPASRASQKRWLHYARETRRHLYHNPDAFHLRENDIKRKTYKLQRHINLAPIKKLLGWQSSEKVDVPMLQRYAHYLNQARIYLGGEKTRFSLANAAPFVRHKIYQRIKKGKSEKSGKNRKDEAKQEYAINTNEKRRKKWKRGEGYSDDEEENDDEIDDDEVNEEINPKNRRESDEFEIQGVKRELEALPARESNQRRKASSGVRFDLPSDDEGEEPEPDQRPEPPPPAAPARRVAPPPSSKPVSRLKATLARKAKSKPKDRSAGAPKLPKTFVVKRAVPLQSVTIAIDPYEEGGPRGPLIENITVSFDAIRDYVEKRGGLLDDDMMNGIITLMQYETLPGVRLMTTYEFASMNSEADVTRKLNAHMRSVRWAPLADMHTIIYPCHINTNHWIVVVANREDRCLRYYDSLHGMRFERHYLPDFLRLLWPPRKGQHDEWAVVREECDKQVGATDCGIFCLDNVHTLVLGAVPALRDTVRGTVDLAAYHKDMKERRAFYGKVLRQETLTPK